MAAALCALAMVLSGCSWLPAYMKAKAAINTRYEAKEAKLEQRYAQGQMSDESYERQYEELYRQWDQELTVAKARAQGYEVSSSRGSSRKRQSSSASRNASAKPPQFDTYTAEYVGSTSSSSSGANASSSSSEAKPPQ